MSATIKLKGWCNPLEQYIVDAIEAGHIKVVYDKKSDTEYLKGKTINSKTGIIIEFQ